MRRHLATSAALVATALALLVPGSAQAYIGPGAGLGAIALTVALLVGVVLLVIGLVWYPLKRLLKGKPTPVAKRDTTDQLE